MKARAGSTSSPKRWWTGSGTSSRSNRRRGGRNPRSLHANNSTGQTPTELASVDFFRVPVYRSSQIDDQIRFRQLDLAAAALALQGQALVDADALLPASLGVMMTDQRVFHPALVAPRDNVFDAPVSPIDPRHPRRHPDALAPEILFQVVLPVEVGQVGVLAMFDDPRLSRQAPRPPRLGRVVAETQFVT